MTAKSNKPAPHSTPADTAAAVDAFEDARDLTAKEAAFVRIIRDGIVYV